MEQLAAALTAAWQEDASQYTTRQLREAMQVMAGLMGYYREILRQRGADGA